MNVSRPLKILLLALTLWPVFYIVAFMLMIANHTMFASVENFHILMLVHTATALTMLGTLAFYLVHLFKHQGLASDTRIMWCLVLLLAAPIGMPLYFFAHVWPETN